MSAASDRGHAYELKIQKLTAKKLQLEVRRDPRSGAGWVHKGDIRDRFGELPLSVEIKDQETLKLKEWWREADAKASFGQAPAVVFPMETEDLVILRYTDLLNFIKEAFDYRAEAEDLRMPALQTAEPSPGVIPKTAAEVKQQVAQLPPRRTLVCKEGHIANEYGQCIYKGCKFSRGYKPKKEGKK